MFAVVARGLDRWLSLVIILVLIGPAAREIQECAARGPGKEQGNAEDELG